MMWLIAMLTCIALGGGLGALAREGSMTLMKGILGLPASVSLGLVNVLGSFLIGLAFSRLEGSLRRDGSSRLADLPHADVLEDRAWWPDGDPTLPAVDLLRFEIALQLASGLIITGFLGAYTTFSAFCLLTVQLLQAGRFLEAAVHVGGSIILGLAAAWTGAHLGCRMSRRA